MKQLEYILTSNQTTMKLIIALLIFTVLTSCGDHKVDTKIEGERLMQISREWSKLAATDSVEKILSYWADDAVVMSPGQSPLKGKNAIREMLEGTSKIPGFKISWEPLSVFVSKSGDMAYLIEQNQITVNDSLGKPITEFNKGVTIWRKEADGSWRNIVDMWNADTSQKK
jgi:ketosteroid isomerase-like protein